MLNPLILLYLLAIPFPTIAAHSSDFTALGDDALSNTVYLREVQTKSGNNLYFEPYTPTCAEDKDLRDTNSATLSNAVVHSDCDTAISNACKEVSTSKPSQTTNCKSVVGTCEAHMLSFINPTSCAEQFLKIIVECMLETNQFKNSASDGKQAGVMDVY